MALNASTIADHDSNASTIAGHCSNTTVAVLAYREYAGSVSGDRSSLCALFTATCPGGASWTRMSNWNTSRPIKEWQGVYMSCSGRVQMIRLWSNSLKGPLPSQLGDLTALVELNLSRNALLGNIPPEIGQLGSLKIVLLHKNKLDGLIPPELGDLAGLETLNLSFNKLHGGLPPELGNLRALLTLEMQNNQLEGSIPSAFGNLQKLECMNLDGNRIQSVSDERPGFPHIRTYFDLRKVKVEIDGYAVEAWRARLRGQQQQQDSPTSTEYAPVEQQQPRTLPVALPVDCVQGAVSAIFSVIGADTSTVAGDGSGGGTLPVREISARTITGGIARNVDRTVSTYGSAIYSGVGSAGGQRDTTEEALRHLAAQYPALHRLASDHSSVLGEMRQIIAGQMDVGPGVQINRASVEECVLRELYGLAQKAEGFRAATSRIEPTAGSRQEELPSSRESSLDAYHTTLARGFRIALLAAYVIDSSLVTRRGMADVEAAGSVLNVIAFIAPDVIGLKTLAERLKAGPRFLQAGKPLQITGVAVDFLECGGLAGRVARMVYGGKGGHAREERRDHGPDSTMPNAGLAFGWFVDHVASCCIEPEYARESDTSTKEGQRKAVVDLSKMLLAVEQGHLCNAHGIDEKVKALVQALHLPTWTAPPNSELQPATSAGQVAALKASLDASNIEIEKLQSEVEGLKDITRQLMIRLGAK